MREKRGNFLSIIAIYTFVILPIISSLPVNAEAIYQVDRIAPTIIHDPPKGEHPKGQDIRISAIITDDDNVERATLYYRKEGQTKYVPMEMVCKEGIEYIAVIPGDAIEGENVEYYIEAMDMGGNLTRRGLPIIPLVVLGVPQIKIAEGLGKEEEVTKPWHKKWWLWAVALLLVGGGVAAAGSGGGGGEESGTVTVGW